MNDELNGIPGSPGTPGENERITDLMIAHLSGTRPWVLFLAILNIIGAAGMALFGLVSLVGGACLGSRGGMNSPFSSFGSGSTGPMTAVVGFIYLALSAAYVPIIVHLFRYVQSIQNLAQSGRGCDLEEALRHQKQYWKYVGILSIVGMVIAFVVVIAAVMIAVGTEMNLG